MPLPVIPLKEFNIENGSYVQWSGDPMDPYLNLTATERIRTNVTLSGQNPRMVNFDVGIALKQQLENLGLQFVLTAPRRPGDADRTGAAWVKMNARNWQSA